MAEVSTLKRRIGLGLLTAYGVGVMVGAGIYVLVGAVAGVAGIWAPLAFLLAGLIAAPSALSYAEMATRIPEAAGEAAYIEKGLGLHWLALVVGIGIVVAGTVSAGAVLRGGTGYLTGIVNWPSTWVMVALGSGLILVAIAGVLESLALAALFTIAEVLGLLMIIWAGATVAPTTSWQAPQAPVWGMVGIAATLAFFAFIGFEDIVNMAEEVMAPERTLPLAILLSLAITTLLYVAVSLAAVRAVPLEILGQSERPLALVWSMRTGQPANFLSVIAVMAALNGVLAQIVMAARVLFGLGKRSAVFAVFHRSHPSLGTPVLATLLVGGFVILAALNLSVADLAEITSAVLLFVFLVVNISLVALKRRAPEAPFRVPDWVPYLGAILSLGALAWSIGGML